MKKIPLTRGMFAVVDDEDFDWLNQWKWHAKPGTTTFYASRWDYSNPIKKKNILMHRHILGVDDRSVLVDHVDHNGLNNTRKNLRKCTHSQNMWNRTINTCNKAGFKGVCRNGSSFSAEIQISGKRVYLGTFDTAEEAARHYNQAAVKHFSDFSNLNNVRPIFPTLQRAGLRKDNSSGYVGVYWYKNSRWACAIRFKYKRIHIGYFDTAEEAARAYDAKARELYGDNARLNFPQQ